MSRDTVFVSIDIDNGVLTAVCRGILDGKRRDDQRTTRHSRRGRTSHIRCAHHQRVCIGGHLKRLGRHTVSVTPRVIFAIDGVGIDERTVATTVRQRARIRTVIQFDGISTIDNNRFRGSMNLAHTMHVGRVVLFRSELTGSQRVNKLPDGTVSSAIGVAITVGHRTRAVRVNHGRTIYIDRDNPVSASIGNRVHLRTFHIHQTGGASLSVGRNH